LPQLAEFDHQLIGQERAKEAVAFGLGVSSSGYNMYVMGEQATGRFTLIRDYIQQHQGLDRDSFDWLYLNNLENEREPKALKMPAGESAEFVQDIETFIDEVLATFPASYQGVRPLIKDLEQKYKNHIPILQYLKSLKSHMVETIVEVLSQEHKDTKNDDYDRRSMLVEMYLPNSLVTNKRGANKPLVYEANPSYQNLFGKIEYTSVQGSVYTNYRMITAGALHRANGGYLVLDADKLLAQAHVWEALKMALKFERIRLELPQQEVGMVNSITQTPEPIPLSCKVILLGSRDIYYSLQDYDPEFPELFRVLVDFENEIDLNPSNLKHFIVRLNGQGGRQFSARYSGRPCAN